MAAKKPWTGFSPLQYALMSAAALATLLFCVCAGSVRVPRSKHVRIVGRADGGMNASIIWTSAPSVLAVMLSGDALAAGGAMQGLLKTRGRTAPRSRVGGRVAAASLSIALGLTLRGHGAAARPSWRWVFAFLSLARSWASREGSTARCPPTRSFGGRDLHMFAHSCSA